MNTPSTCSAEDEEQSGMPTLSRELTHCKRVAWRYKVVQQVTGGKTISTKKSKHLEGGEKGQCRFEGKQSWSNTAIIPAFP
jgi:hypothetical protein